MKQQKPKQTLAKKLERDFDRLIDKHIKGKISYDDIPEYSDCKIDLTKSKAEQQTALAEKKKFLNWLEWFTHLTDYGHISSGLMHVVEKQIEFEKYKIKKLEGK